MVACSGRIFLTLWMVNYDCRQLFVLENLNFCCTKRDFQKKGKKKPPKKKKKMRKEKERRRTTFSKEFKSSNIERQHTLSHIVISTYQSCYYPLLHIRLLKSQLKESSKMVTVFSLSCMKCPLVKVIPGSYFYTQVVSHQNPESISVLTSYFLYRVCAQTNSLMPQAHPPSNFSPHS